MKFYDWLKPLDMDIEIIIIFTLLSNKMVRPKKVDIVYKYIGYKLKGVMDTETFCYRQQRNNS
jgi:hypothetical protein